DGNANNPWNLVVPPVSYHHNDLILYRLGDDEGLREGMFGHLATKLDGVVIVRTKLWFTFTSQFARVARTGSGHADPRDFPHDTARLDASCQFNSFYCGPTPMQSLHRLAIKTPAGSRMKNIAILFQPHYAFMGSQPSDAHVQVELVFDGHTPAAPDF